MPLDQSILTTARKMPRQARAKETVNAILEAAARILEKKGEAALSTASAAQLAGCSIGTLYQYFADRDEILMALVDREHRRIVGKAREAIKALGPGPAAAREIVRALIASFAARRGAVRQFQLLMSSVDKAGKPTLASAFAEAIVRSAGPGLGEDERRIVEARAFVLTRALHGVLRSAALENDSIIKEPAFEDALCLLVEALQPPPRQGSTDDGRSSGGGRNGTKS